MLRHTTSTHSKQAIATQPSLTTLLLSDASTLRRAISGPLPKNLRGCIIPHTQPWLCTQNPGSAPKTLFRTLCQLHPVPAIQHASCRPALAQSYCHHTAQPPGMFPGNMHMLWLHLAIKQAITQTDQASLSTQSIPSATYCRCNIVTVIKCLRRLWQPCHAIIYSASRLLPPE